MYKKWDSFAASLSDSESEEDDVRNVRAAHLTRRSVQAETDDYSYRFGWQGDQQLPSEDVISLHKYWWEDHSDIAVVHVQLPRSIRFDYSSQFRVQSFEINLWSRSEVHKAAYRFAICKLPLEIIKDKCECKLIEAKEELIITLVKFGKVRWPSLSI